MPSRHCSAENTALYWSGVILVIFLCLLLLLLPIRSGGFRLRRCKLFPCYLCIFLLTPLPGFSSFPVPRIPLLLILPLFRLRLLLW